MSDAAAAPTPESARREFSDAEVVQLLLDWRLAAQEELKTALGKRKDNTPILQHLIGERIVTAGQAIRVRRELAMVDKPLQQIPGYQFIERLGSGGMGVVYKARQLRMDRLVAIKLLKRRLSSVPRFVERFLKEAKVVAKLSHNHIVQAIDAGEAYGYHYLVMEFIEGTNVSQLLRKKGPFEEAEALRIVHQVAMALEHAHKRNLIHRDIKPENIMLTNEGVAKLADLGLARFANEDESGDTDEGFVVGTVYYIAPEQIRGAQDIDSRADIYSLGATLYAMVAGKPPFSGERTRELLVKHLETTPTPLNRVRPEVSDGLSIVVDTMLAKDPRDRYPTPTDLMFDLQCLMSGQPPRLAQERISLRTLAELAEGEPVDDRGGVRRRARITAAQPAAGGKTRVLMFLLGLSFVANLVLLLWRG